MAQTDMYSGLRSEVSIKAPVKAATTAAITLSGAQTVDGVSLVAGDRVLVKDQATGSDNGIWTVMSGTWDRAPDFDGNYDVVKGTMVTVVSGAVNAGRLFKVTTADPIVIGTSSLSFAEADLGVIPALFATKAEVQAHTFISAPSNILVAGRTYRQTSGNPSPSPGVQSADGTWFVLSEPEVTLEDFGAVGDYDPDTEEGTDDTAAVQAALAAGGRIYKPEGYFLTTLAFADLVGATFYGPGFIVTSDSGTNRIRAQNIYHWDSPPDEIVSGTSVILGFDAEFKSDLVYEFHITGATTAGDPGVETSYTVLDQVAPRREGTLFESGKNASPYNTAGRTGFFHDLRRFAHRGKGDGWEAAWFVSVQQADDSIVGCHGIPAGGQLGGGTSAADDDVILQNIELSMSDNGYDVVGKSLIFNLTRTNATAAKDQYWTGIRLQSAGTQKPDAGYQLTGSWRNGIDLSVGGTIDRAIALKAGQGIHYDAVAKYIRAAPLWVTSTAFAAGSYCYNAQKVYYTAAGGTTGATPPTHSSGTVSDGAVDWQFVSNHSFIGYASSDGGTRTYFDSASSELRSAILGNTRLVVRDVGIASVGNTRSGQTANTAADNFVIDTNSATPGMTIMGGANNAAIIGFANPSEPLRGYMRYRHATDLLDFNIAGTKRVEISTSYLDLNNIELRYAGTKVLGARDTGWTASTGTGAKSGVNMDWTQSISNPPTQAEVQAIVDQLTAVSKLAGQTQAALTTHGVIGT